MKLKGKLDLLHEITTKLDQEFLDTRKNILRTGDRISLISFDEQARLEATSLYQTESDLALIRDKLQALNKRSGSLTFISEAIVKAVDVVNKYDKFFPTNALYVFTDGKSEPYSPRWPRKKIQQRKKRDAENFRKIALAGRNKGLNVWVGVLKWAAFKDARSLVGSMGKTGHLVDLTDFSRLSLEKALQDFARSVRAYVKVPALETVNLGTIPFKADSLYEKTISLPLITDKIEKAPPITGVVKFEPDNPSAVSSKGLIQVKTTEDRLVLDFRIANSAALKAGRYKGKVKLMPVGNSYGAVLIEPSQFEVRFKKSGAFSYYASRAALLFLFCSLVLLYLTSKIKRKIPLKV
ncbi:MAG: VWA domain-containing protein [Deltaproteobacteria bacterium]|nr:VWA domain-containing protein [Deltaproteobacteria bacterium]